MTTSKNVKIYQQIKFAIYIEVKNLSLRVKKSSSILSQYCKLSLLYGQYYLVLYFTTGQQCKLTTILPLYKHA